MILKHYLELIRLYWWHMLLLIALSTCAFGLVGYFQLKTSPQYTASASVLLIPSQSELEFGLSGSTARSGMQTMSETYMEYVKSRPVVEATLTKIDEMYPPSEEEPSEPETMGRFSQIADRAGAWLGSIKRKLTELNSGTYVEIPQAEKRISEIQDAISVRNVASTHILQIEVTLDDPEYAALVANTLAEAYVERVTEESNSFASEHELFLQDQIDDTEKRISDLRTDKERLNERFGLGNTFIEGIEDQQRILETTLAELNSRMLTLNLSRGSSSAAEARLIEPARAPNYASSPGVVSMTLIGLVIGVILAAGTVVVRDIASDTIKTSTDLNRLVGSRSIGLLRRSRLVLLPRALLRPFGLQVQQHFALSRISGPSRQTKGRRAAGLTPLLSAPRSPVLEGESSLVADTQQGMWSRLNDTARNRNARRPTRVVQPQNSTCYAQITGLVAAKTLARATVHVAAGLASIGNNVYCKLPEGLLGSLPRFNFSRGGKVVYSPPEDGADNNAEYIMVECLGPMNAQFAIDGTGERELNSPLICVVPQDRIPERVVTAMLERIRKNDSGDWHFLMMSSAKAI